eukprot:TRINITY_DN58411_c0_g1_i1.p1 TRINITY_DN58411_c0_g1~~TRINITY_DN58411_c0_g1_i1.p1  ORF type:complete len:246 (+),score=34.28 TRINITY_DN58411_c0_g1_i1:319-1056(+)
MLGKRSRPSIRRVPETIIPGDRMAFSDPISSPTSPVESKNRSSNGWRDRDLGGVGLAIVAALDKSSTEIGAKLIVGSLSLSKSDPIPIGLRKNSYKSRGGFDELRCSESYTFVTSHVSNKTTITRVGCDGREGGGGGGEFHGSEFDRRLRNFGMFFASPPGFIDEIPATHKADFLSSCYLCRKKLHGKDIYMYRGEKAFCSTECRNRQIVSDERKEKCGSEASKTSDSSLYYDSGRLFSPGVVAA